MKVERGAKLSTCGRRDPSSQTGREKQSEEKRLLSEASALLSMLAARPHLQAQNRAFPKFSWWQLASYRPSGVAWERQLVCPDGRSP